MYSLSGEDHCNNNNNNRIKRGDSVIVKFNYFWALLLTTDLIHVLAVSQ